MKLYHGTSAHVAQEALYEGLLPRNLTGTPSCWTSCPSRDDLVYLTTAYAGYFALHATKELEPWGIVEVDTDRMPGFADYLVPDEDWLEQNCRCAPDLPPKYEILDIEERTAYWREQLHLLTHLWKDSVEGLGTCAHLGPIAPDVVTRVAIFDPKSNPQVASLVLDPTISLLNYRLRGSKYRALTRWFFDEPVSLADVFAPGHLFFSKKEKEMCESYLAKRDGIEILKAE